MDTHRSGTRTRPKWSAIRLGRSGGSPSGGSRPGAGVWAAAWVRGFVRASACYTLHATLVTAAHFSKY
eukprot:scaffold36091_cov67-Phaeocystis_antarctica.AAC.5